MLWTKVASALEGLTLFFHEHMHDLTIIKISCILNIILRNISSKALANVVYNHPISNIFLNTAFLSYMFNGTRTCALSRCNMVDTARVMTRVQGSHIAMACLGIIFYQKCYKSEHVGTVRKWVEGCFRVSGTG